uniref:Salivary lipocalin n=1 Tax=Dipetalogaster maximus TaxID=72496 RepID=G3CJS2_DIPMA
MKTFNALIFIGILTCAHNTIGVTGSECNMPSPMAGFEKSKFFTGMWYVTHETNVTTPSECNTLTTRLENNKVFVEHKYVKDGKTGTLVCEGQEDGQNMFPLNCKFNGVTMEEVTRIVMDTDYNDYALYYLCTAYKSGVNTGKKAEHYIISRREPKDDIPEKLRSQAATLQLQKCGKVAS